MNSIELSRSMNSFRLGAFCAIFCLVPLASGAEGSRLQYNYVEGGYARAQIDVLGDIDANLYGIGGSFAVADNVFVQGAYERTEFEKILGVDLSANTFQVGVGGHMPIADSTDLVLSAEYVYVDVQASGFGFSASDNESGFDARIGVRSLLADDAIELAGGATYIFIDSDGEAGIDGSIRYHFTDQVSAAVGAAWAEDTIAGSISLRFAW